MAITLQKPSAEDLPDLLSLWEGQYEFHHNLDPEYYVPNSPELKEQFTKYLKSAIENDKPFIIAAYVDDVLAGFITFEEGSADYFDSNITKFGLLLEMFVDPVHRSKGIATRLMKKAEDTLAGMGYEWIEFQCSTFNTYAIKLYEHLGYTNRQSFFYKRVKPEKQQI